MPVFINEIVIKTNVEPPKNEGKSDGKGMDNQKMEDIVKQAVERVFEIMEQKKER